MIAQAGHPQARNAHLRDARRCSATWPPLLHTRRRSIGRANRLFSCSNQNTLAIIDPAILGSSGPLGSHDGAAECSVHTLGARMPRTTVQCAFPKPVCAGGRAQRMCASEPGSRSGRCASTEARAPRSGACTRSFRWLGGSSCARNSPPRNTLCARPAHPPFSPRCRRTHPSRSLLQAVHS